jgi:ribonucleotide monophosphatase NagD (HAD superfamily)
VITSAYATAVYASNTGIKNCYCIGGEGLVMELAEQGINSTGEDCEDMTVDAIIIGLDPDFNYAKLEKALNIYAKNKCPIIACNLDKSFPVENFRLKPGTGAIASAVANAADCLIIDIGKPRTYMLELLCSVWNYKADEILVVGDSFESDIEMAVNFNSPSILVSGNVEYIENEKSIRVESLREIKGLFSIPKIQVL